MQIRFLFSSQSCSPVSHSLMSKQKYINIQLHNDQSNGIVHYALHDIVHRTFANESIALISCFALALKTSLSVYAFGVCVAYVVAIYFTFVYV